MADLLADSLEEFGGLIGGFSGGFCAGFFRLSGGFLVADFSSALTAAIVL